MKRVIIETMTAAFLVFWTVGAHGVPQRFPDPRAETAFPENDLVEVSTEIVAGKLQVVLRYAGVLGLTDGNYGTIFIDGDLNSDTGGDLGTEAVVDYVFTGVYTGGSVRAGDRVMSLGEEGTAVEAGSDTVTFQLPLALWSGQRPPYIFVASAGTIASTFYDRVPDAGWMDVSNGLAVLPRPGNPQGRVSCADPVQDAVWPDLQEFSMEVVDGNLCLWLSFSHGVEKRHLQEVQDTLVINISFDMDRRLWTGFRNNHEVPPTFGIDRQIQIMLNHLFPQPDAVLRWPRQASTQDPTAELRGELEGIGLGDQHSDTRCVVGTSAEFGTAQNQIFLSIPLAYLGYCDTRMFVMVDAFLEANISPGHADSLPDQGALNTAPGLTADQRIQPVATGSQPESVVADLTDDSTWGGYHGDEIIQTRACPLSDGGLAIRVDLEQLEYSDMAFVNVFVDSDGLATSGIPVVNNSADTMGADFCVSCQFSRAPEPTIVSALFVDLRQTPFWPGPLRAAHLVSARAGGIFNSQQPGGFFIFNFPPEVLNCGPAGWARYLVTTTRQAYSAIDQTRYFDQEEDEENPDVKRSGIIHITPTGRSAIVDSAPNAGFHAVSSPSRPPLEVLSVRPTRGPSTGGTQVTIAGRSFSTEAKVHFGNQQLSPAQVIFLSSGGLRVVAPPGNPGPVPVTVSDPQTGRTAVAPRPFVYGDPVVLAPRILVVEPSLGPVAGGNTLQLHGANFVEQTAVTIGDRPALMVQRNSPFQLTVQAPPGTIGSATVTVTAPDGLSASLPDGYNYGARPPEVWTVVPGFGPVAGDAKITIVGKGFESGCIVYLGGLRLSQLQFESAQVLSGMTPAMGAPGPADLAVVNPNGTRRTLPGAYHFGLTNPQWPAPSILGVTPMSSPTDGGIAVRIIGTAFQPNAAIFFDRIPVQAAYDDPNLIETVSPPHASGPVAITVVNPDGQTAVLPADQGWNSFSYDSNDPSLSLVFPMNSPTAGGQEITLFGGNFRAGAEVEFGGVPAVSADIGETVIIAVTPPHAPGPVAIRVTNPGGLTTLYEEDIIFGQFEYQGPPPGPPSITRVIPAEGSVLGGDDIRLEGVNLYAGMRVFFAGNEASLIRQHLTDSVSVRLPPGPQGPVELRVRNADGQSSIMTGGFRYVSPIPRITSITPGRGPASGSTVVEVKGTNFLPDVRVTFDGLAARTIRWINPQTVQAATPPGIPGAVPVQAINPGEIAGSGPSTFTYEGESAPVPQIEGIEPDRGPIQGGHSVTIRGSDFLAGAIVLLGNQPLTEVIVESADQLSGRVPPAPAGAVDVTVKNRDGQTAIRLGGYVYLDPQAPAPLVQSVSPATGSVAGDTEVVVAGAHFQPGARVFFGAIGLPDWTLASPAELHGITPPGTAGSVTVRVVNPDGQSTALPSAFTYTDEIPRPRFARIECNLQQLILQVENLLAGTPYVLERRSRVHEGPWETRQEFQAAHTTNTLNEHFDQIPAEAFYRIRALP
ncbi:MAG TPA: IPT/TIG domain-containing protein [Candidatus Paceibacterota bacterium]|nr:IPT/TIG domain-containing protein [Candidatus Paceibacterota bacterium]